MSNTLQEVESFQPFSESQIWQINRDYYQQIGIEAWSNGKVPHQATSNSLVGKTYAELILGFLIDLSSKGQVTETVYILELGAGHGRLAFHILKHLEKLTAYQTIQLPPYCFILSDIAEKNLDFFKNHLQFQNYFKSGLLDFAYFDAMESDSIHLRNADIKLNKGNLKQPLIALANYFFDSIPNDLFHIQHHQLSASSVALHSPENPIPTDPAELLKSIVPSFWNKPVEGSHYASNILNEILEDYRTELTNTYLFFPKMGIDCIENMKAISSKGLLVLSMDKGFHKMTSLDKKNKPELITHGSFSLWANYHALGSYCEKSNGKVLFPSFSNFHLEVCCLLFLENTESYKATDTAYQRYVNDFGPDDYNSVKKFTQEQIENLSLIHLLALLRFSSYDSSLFINMLPHLKILIKKISHKERERVRQTLHQVWHYYFNINENRDLANAVATIYFDLGYYEEALEYFQYSTDDKGAELDTTYNKILCHYQLRQDLKFAKALTKAKKQFPDSEIIMSLDKLDLNAV